MEEDGYFVWDDALREEYFGSHAAGELVYLDSDAEAFEKACARVGVSVEEGPHALAEAVRGRLYWRTSARPTFGYFDKLASDWARRRRRDLGDEKLSTPPPLVGLLLLFSMAAEHMGKNWSRTSESESGYYAQLERSLRIPAEESQRMRKSFRTTSERYWEALRLWLEDADGDFGLPSAHTLTHRYVGLPISQALIRDTERRHLHQMFSEQGFAVGVPVPHDEMLGAIDAWMSSAQTHPNAILRKMWTAEDARAKITDAAVNELLSWDGGGATAYPTPGGRGTPARCLLTLRERRRLMDREYAIGVVLNRHVATGDGATVLLADKSAADIILEPLGPSIMGISTETTFDPKGLLEGDLRVHWQGELGARRGPKRIVVFARDSTSASYVECDRLPASSLSRILVKDEDGLPNAVRTVLVDAAASSYEEVAGERAGIPSGWILFTDVQLLRPPAAELTAARSDLSCFQPRISTQIAIRGGIRLPGRLPRWVADGGMEALITSDDNAPVDVVCLRTDPETLEHLEEPLAVGLVPPAWVPLPGVGAEDLTLSLRRRGTVLQELTVRIRNSDSPRDTHLQAYESLCHDREDPLWPLTAAPVCDVEEVVADGALTIGDPVDAPEIAIGSRPDWRAHRVPPSRRELLRISAADRDSCLVTGRHKMELPVAGPKPTHKWMYGTCANCHTSKRYPTRAPRGVRKTPAPAVSREPLPPAHKLDSDWSSLIDALTYLGRGTLGDFAALARQLEDSSFFVHQALNALEALSTLEVERGPALELVGWEMATSVAAELQDGSWILTGHMPRSISIGIVEAVGELGGWHRFEDPRTKSTVVGGLSRSVAESLFREFGLECSRAAAQSLAAVLPTMSSVVRSLARDEMRLGGELEFFDLASAQWAQIRSPGVIGAYRITSRFGVQCFFRDEADLDGGTWRRMPPNLAKHAAAAAAGRSVVRYDKARGILAVPPGCEMPGLYGRSAVLCSGRLPEFDRETYALEYPGVDADTARLLVGKVMS